MRLVSLIAFSWKVTVRLGSLCCMVCRPFFSPKKAIPVDRGKIDDLFASSAIPLAAFAHAVKHDGDQRQRAPLSRARTAASHALGLSLHTCHDRGPCRPVHLRQHSHLFLPLGIAFFQFQSLPAIHGSQSNAVAFQASTMLGFWRRGPRSENILRLHS